MPVQIRKPNRLIVEGHDDKFSVVGLMSWYINWPNKSADAPVWIDVGNSADEILEPAYLSALLKSRETDVLGIMLDADAKPDGRYESIRKTCSPVFPKLPRQMPSGGLVANEEGKRLGLWIMPDNAAHGCLETFLRYLVPEESERLWTHAVESVCVAKTLGAPCREVHRDKANLYTWLAWQDPPGQAPGRALTQKILDPQSIHADPFVKWFRALYSV